ncbi:hypothetical protein BDF20DRAFT_558173 [Mycotypha africana]|uniref:uncharacterized protein n=1 Tax=Mycotypha africana TaxID=64632 RepID=UPI0023012725|nr:uncharacterized protein BDF20DRAFT_558173 [Mycotypha africana]KAI8977303.1 hypothetical protein BDF20DRAFT_558173 [Mycotypha africana]
MQLPGLFRSLLFLYTILNGIKSDSRLLGKIKKVSKNKTNSCLCHVCLRLVNALSVVDKRAIMDTSPQLCAGDLDSVGMQLGELQAAIMAGGVLNIKHDYHSVNRQLDAAQDSCCGLNQQMTASTTDANMLLQSLAAVVPKAQNALTEIKNMETNSNFLTRLFVKSYLEDMDRKTAALQSCFSQFMPTANATTVQAYFNEMDEAFNVTKSAYGI